MTVLFADIADSVALHGMLGDIEAHEKIVNCLDRMSDIIVQHHGKVIEKIGDEIMCIFSTADQALHAACSVQEVVQKSLSYQVNVKVGFSHGLTNVDKGHPFGDTVNVAARMVKMAKAGQIIISDEAFQHLSNACKKQTRHFNHLLLKGKQVSSDVYEVVWDRADSTIKFTRLDELELQRNTISAVEIKYLGEEQQILVNSAPVQIGRGQRCGLQVHTDVASRLHAEIKTLQGKIVFSDLSTNGSFIKTNAVNGADKDNEIYLHHDDWVMEQNGSISLGEPISGSSEHLVEFYCH